MFNKLSLRMAVTYGLIIILTIIVLDTIILIAYQEKQLAKNEAKNLWFGSIMANLAKDMLDDRLNLNGAIRENSANTGNRVLIINTDKKVIADSSTTYIGKVISNREIEESLKNATVEKGYYKDNNSNILMLTVPINIASKTMGVVLISAYIDDIYQDVADLRLQIIIISIAAGLLAILLAWILGKKLSKPVELLNNASSEIIKGKLNTKVDIRRTDEIGKLADTFNIMSEEIYRNDVYKRRLISDVSHELKTPLTSIKALIESLIDGNNNIETYNEYLTDVNNEIDRLSLLVKSILTATRLEEVEIIKEEINVFNEVESIIRLLNNFAKQKNITIYNNCSKDFTIFADKNMLKEVLINLIDNSIKYGKADGSVWIESNEEDIPRLSIRDNGCGIPEGEQPYIFDVFYRVDKSRTRDTGGNGIGLYIVNKIVKLHEWEIEVSSKENIGSVFTLVVVDKHDI